jgi:uncharacterized protein YydD (DUF2326 family)
MPRPASCCRTASPVASTRSGAFTPPSSTTGRSHLSGEVQGAERRIAEREREQAELDRRRARIMDLLRAHGALDQLTQLQNELSRVEAQAEPLRQALDTAERVESTAADVKIERAALYKRLQDDYHDEHEVIEEAVVTFAELSAAL